jgi:hypothetical protein
MKVLPKGLKRINKVDFSERLMMTKVDEPFVKNDEAREYIEWSNLENKKQHRKSFRW